MTIRCCRCKRILVNAGPEFPISDTVCQDCWAPYRTELGLKPKPFPAVSA